VEIYSPSMKNKITVKKVKSRIQSKLHKRMELEYIESTIQGMQKVPDFGFNIQKPDYFLKES
jgi:hypothetical protein